MTRRAVRVLALAGALYGLYRLFTYMAADAQAEAERMRRAQPLYPESWRGAGYHA